MHSITNERFIKRNAFLSKVLSATGLLVLLSGLVASFVRPEWNTLPFYTLVAGFLLSNFGMYLANRYARQPRPHEAISNALKGLDDRYRLYHYCLPAAHTLVGPPGVYVLVPKFQGGIVSWDKTRKRLKHHGTSWFRKVFGQESLGNPITEANAEAHRLARYLDKEFGEEAPSVLPLIVFTNPRVEIDNVKQASVPMLKAKRLNPYLRKRPKGDTFSGAQIAALDAKLKTVV